MRPTLSETLKLAWVQYLAILVPVWCLVSCSAACRTAESRAGRLSRDQHLKRASCRPQFWALSCLVFDSGVVDAAADADRVVKAKLH